MITLVTLVIAVLFLAPPWNWIAVIAAALVDIAETLAFLWWSKRRRRLAPPMVGVEDLIGRAGVAATALAPDGQVRVRGEIWQARSSELLDRGAQVVVRSVDGLVLDVEPAPGGDPSRS